MASTQRSPAEIAADLEFKARHEALKLAVALYQRNKYMPRKDLLDYAEQFRAFLKGEAADAS